MISSIYDSRHTSKIAKEDVILPRLLYSDLSWSQICRPCPQVCGWCSQVCGWCSQVCGRCSQVCGRCSQVCGWCSQVCGQCSQVCGRCSQVCGWCFQVCGRCSQVLRGLLLALSGLSPALLVTQKSVRHNLLGSDPLLKLTHLSLHSTSS
jgi:hypothetical protein